MDLPWTGRPDLAEPHIAFSVTPIFCDGIMKLGRLKYPKLLGLLVLLMATFGLAASSVIAGYALIFVAIAALLLVHLRWPTRLGWWLIIIFMVLPVLLITGAIWHFSGYPLSPGDYSGLGRLLAIFLTTMVATVLLIACAAQVKSDPE